MVSRSMIHIGRDRVQLSAWRESSTIANLIPFPARKALTTEAIDHVVEKARERGFTGAYTAALAPPQAEPFLEWGFSLYEELHLLRRDLAEEIPSGKGVTRRARRTDWDDVLELDQLAFQEFWRFDRPALVDAIKATPRHRFQVIKTSPVQGYHVTGLAGMNAYLQRVAVHPDAQGQGYGRALVYDALRWGWRSGASVAQVNTQVINERAVALYERCGFELAPHRLQVLQATF